MKFTKLLLICLIMALTVGLSAAYAQATDLDGNKYRNDVEVLYHLGIMNGYENGDFHPDSTISRQEFVTLIVRILRMEGCGRGKTLSFTDIDTWAQEYIRDASAIGLISGYSSERFAPQDPITVNQAVKIIVTALGYEEYAERNGGYPFGFNSFAAKNKITENVSVGEREATRGEIASMLVRAISTPLSETAVKTDGNKSVTFGEKTIADELNVRIIEGVLIGTGSLNTGTTQLHSDEIEIGDEVFKTTLTGLEAMVGRTVTAYVSKEEYSIELAYHVNLCRKNEKLLTVKASDIDSASTLSQFVYRDERKTSHSIALSNSIFIYNGKPLSSADISDAVIRPESGNVTFTDSNNDGKYDVIMITEFETYIVSSVIGDTIYDKMGRSISKSTLTDENYSSLSVTKNDEAASFEEIAPDDVLSVAASKDGLSTQIYISDESVSGKITSEAVEDNQKIYTLDDENTELRVSSWLTKRISDGDSRVKKIHIGDSATLLLDVNGEIAFIEDCSENSSLQYGVLVDFGTENELSSGGEIKVLTVDNVFKVYKADGKIKFGYDNGGIYEKGKYDFDAVVSAIEMSAQKVQLIKYAAEGDILKTLYLAGGDDLSEHGNQFRGYYRYGIIDQQYAVDKDTLLFTVPGDGSETEKLSAGRALDLLKNGSSNNIRIFDVKNGHIGAIVKLDTIIDGTLITYIDKANSDIMMIESAKTISGSNSESYLMLTGLVNGEEKSVLLSDTLSSNSRTAQALKKGVIVQYETNHLLLDFAFYEDYDEVVESYEVLHDCNSIVSSYRLWNGSDIYSSNAERSISYGVITFKDDSGFVMSVSDDGSATNACTFSKYTSVCIYNKAEKNCKEASVKDVCEGMTVVARQRYGSLRDVYIIEE